MGLTMQERVITHSTTKVTGLIFCVVSEATKRRWLNFDSSVTASRAVLIGIVTGSVLLVVGLMLVGFYAVRQKKRAQVLVSINNPFGNALS